MVNHEIAVQEQIRKRREMLQEKQVSCLLNRFLLVLRNCEWSVRLCHVMNACMQKREVLMLERQLKDVRLKLVRERDEALRRYLASALSVLPCCAYMNSHIRFEQRKVNLASDMEHAHKLEFVAPPEPDVSLKRSHKSHAHHSSTFRGSLLCTSPRC